MSVTYALSKYLQTVNIDLFAAMDRVQLCVDHLQSMRSDDEAYSELYGVAVGLAEKLGVIPSKPRTVGTQRYRSNQPSDSVEQYYKRAIFIPYLDYLLSSLHARFLEHRREVEGLACLIPAQSQKRSFQEFKKACNFYAEDLATRNDPILQAEWELWQKKWSKVAAEDMPPDAISAINECNRNLFPNIFVLLQIMVTLPVTTAAAERSFSLLKRLKSWLRNAISEDRLVGLAMISFYRDLPLDRKKIILRFLSKKKRRISNK